MNEEELQNKYMELQLAEQQFQQLHHQLESLNQQALDLQKLEVNLDDLKKVKKNSKMLSSLGQGIFFESELKNKDELIVNVGANIMVKKSIADSKKLISKQVKEIENIKENVETQLQNLTLHTTNLQEELQKAIQDKK